jgi:hypothetical protein
VQTAFEHLRWVECSRGQRSGCAGAGRKGPLHCVLLFLMRCRVSQVSCPVSSQAVCVNKTPTTHCRPVLSLLPFRRCPALFLAKDAALSTFSVAKQTSIVVDSGYSCTTGEVACRAVVWRGALGV